MKKKSKIIFSLINFIAILFLVSIFLFPLNIKTISPSTIIYDKNNIEIAEIINDNKTRYRFIKLEDIPDFSKKAIILMEDKSFYNNIGIDFSAIIRAIINNIKSDKKIEGASTISTQLIRNSYWLNKKRTYFTKLKEFYLALVLNTKYSKNKILEYYLNNIYFGKLNYGIQSASYYYFGKDLKNLTKAEQLALLVIPKNSNKYNPYKNYKNYKNFRKRFEKISKYLEKNGFINKQEQNFILNEKLIFNKNHKNKLNYISDFIKEKIKKSQKKSKKIYSTIDYNLTKKIDNIAKNIIKKLAWKDVGDYGILITERKTNNLLVMIGGIDYFSQDGQVNSTTAKRQVGSTIKPFTYLLAFKYLGYNPSTKILDLPVQFETADGNTYAPKNYSLNYKGEVSLAESLSQSLNIPAVKLANQVGLNRLYNFLKKLKISSLNKKPEHYGLALTLGVAEINLFELLQAYSIFANDGNFCYINITKNKNKTCEKIIEKKYIDKVNKILTNRYFKLAGFPINSSMDFPYRNVFVKTGTSRNFRDNWAIGFTKNYTIGVWVGNKNGKYMKGVSGASGAGEIFSKIVKYLEVEQNDISKEKIIFKNQFKFLEITSPLDKSIYKIDKTKPDNIAQIKLEFSTNIKYNKKKWFINNKLIKNNFFKLKKGVFKIKIILYKDSKKIKEKTSTIEVLD